MPGSPEEPVGSHGSRQPRQPHDDSTTPKDLKVKTKEQMLIIDWLDGSRSELPLGKLRRECPCATCRSEREKETANPLKVLKFDPAAIRATGANLVGNYGIKFRWSDGHDTGIFDFRFLRQVESAG